VLDVTDRLWVATQVAASEGKVNREDPTVIRQRPPVQVDVLIDAERGFLHRITG
jgi:hypothetical protein